MKYDYNDLYDGVCTPAQYYAQFKTVKEIVLGGVYLSAKGDKLSETEYTIVYIGEGVALGVESYKGVLNKSKYRHNSVGEKMLFIANKDSPRYGWKLEDSRPLYRLQEID